MRLDRFLSHATGLTRSQAQRAIRGGEVRVADVVVADPGARVDAQSAVEFAGALLEQLRPRYLMLHKPAGYVCATEDPDHRTVLDLLDPQTQTARHAGRSRRPVLRGTRAPLHIAGRLDIDATGLVLITDDGSWSHRVTSPRYKIPKTYRVILETPLDDAAATRLRAGVALRDEPRRCAPADLEPLARNVWRVTIREGKYHQVKRMFAAVGNRVLALHRERIGELTLDPNLPRGRFGSSVSSPMRSRCNASTRLPTAANMRLTWWYFPSLMVTRQTLRARGSRSAGAQRRGSSRSATPARSLVAAASSSGVSSITR